MKFNITDISRKTGISKERVKAVLTGKVHKETAIKSISEVLGLSQEELLKEILGNEKEPLMSAKTIQ